MKKKGSLSLSINAIVILVLAITMLGLGLAFTKGMFGKLSEKLSVPEPDIPATADDPISLPADELTLTKSKQFVFSANAYNDDFENDVYGWLFCKSDSITQAGAINVCSGPQAIPPGEDKGFKFIIDKDDVGRISVTRVCNIRFFDTPSAYACPTGDAGAVAADATAVESKQIVVAIK